MCIISLFILLLGIFYHVSLIKDKWRHIKILRAYLSKNGFELGSTKPEVVKENTPRQEPGGRLIKRKYRINKRTLIYGSNLKSS